MSDDEPGGARCRPGFRWPDGIRAAACFTFDVDAESPILFEHPEAADWLDVMSHQAYGAADRDPAAAPPPRPARDPGDLLHPGLSPPSGRRRSAARSGTPATRSPTTATCTRAPTEPAPRSRSGGSCAASRRSTRSLGVRPIGYRGPNWELTYETPALLGTHGFAYDSRADGRRPSVPSSRRAPSPARRP